MIEENISWGEEEMDNDIPESQTHQTKNFDIIRIVFSLRKEKSD
jgi:hypothetical protein